ncbi:tetratricopeptide repeat protein [Hymenobacter negativus]|uniref:Tetratricopeptide repeat protein n=1 Tax=Hymenobacter negativus TaxID=2795026 RepID=A0ABS3QBG6_9BACT|nr:tetratricopeptide repeat protein [Hymenobacter negativus]MBO2008169.1 tetratricopeptide repeat protein [Hymenobacter negativus]
MMKAFLFLLLISCARSVAAQTAPAAHDLVEQGIKLYDAGQYAEAEAKYKQALAIAPNDALTLSELALTYNSMGRNKEAAGICEQLVKADPNADQSVYVTYGNSLDALKKTKEAIHIYEDGLKHHPGSSELHFNMGVAQATSGQVPACIGSFQQAIALSPNHASSHMSLGVMQLANQSRIPGILSLGRFLVLEPGSARSAQRLPMLDKAMSLGVTRTGEKSIAINISSSALNGTNGKSDGPDNFGPAELLLSITRASTLDKGVPALSSLEQFSQQFAALCKGLGELSSKQQGFTWNYYVPYFVEMEKKGFVPAFTYLSHSSQTEVPAVQKWLAAHPNEVAVFQEWSKNYAWPKALK